MMNNYERIKQMSVDELSRWLRIFGKISCEMCICKPNGNYKSEECYKYKNCIEPVILGLKDYLLQECE